MSKTLRTLLIILGAVVALALIVFIVNRVRGGQASSATNSQVGLSTTTSSGIPTLSGAITNEVPSVASARTRELVDILNSVSTLRLDKAVFDHPGFNLLRDVSTNLPPVSIVGRNNPFLPIGAGGRNTSFTSSDINTSSGAFGTPQSSGAVIRINTDANTSNQSSTPDATTSTENTDPSTTSIETENQDLVGEDAVNAFLESGGTTDASTQGDSQ